jgi:hypothetical protein
MPHTVKLAGRDQILLLSLLADSYEYKSERKLRNEDSIKKMSEYYIDAAEKIRDNYIDVNSTKSNFFKWVSNQLSHSGTKIWTSEECQEAIRVCEACSNNTYEKYRAQRAANKLFEVNADEEK